MKTRIFIYSLIFIGLITSCEDLINLDQPDIIEQEQAFDDENSTRLSMLGLYGLMADMAEPLFLAGEVRADLVTATGSAETYIKEYSNNSFSASNPYISPKQFYTLINNVNDFIYEFEKLLADGQMDYAEFINYKSELVSLRVWSQFQIARIFGSLKYYSQVLTSEETISIEELPYGDELLGKLIEDLTFSDTLTFTPENEDIIWQTIRFSDFYVNSLMGEIYLDMGDYTNAYSKFNEIILKGDKYNRKPTSKFFINERYDDYEMEWMDELFAESWESSSIINQAVFMLAYDNKYNQTNELWNWTASLDYQVAPSDWYIEDFNESAVLNEGFLDYRLYSILNSDSELDREYSIAKFPADDSPLIFSRTARLELLKAFCMNANGRFSTALKSINKVRKRIGLPEVDEELLPGDDEAALIWLEDVIIQELAYETGFEGGRWYDLVRVAKRRNDVSYLADKIAQKYSEESREEIREKLLDQNNWFLPVFE